MSDKSTNLIWIDLEMTGLIPRRDKIIEIATIVTDLNLNVLAKGPELAIKQPKELLNSMDAWNSKQHKSSGLLERIELHGVSIDEAQQKTLDFLKEYSKPKASPICGNSVCQDRRFLYEEMPELEKFFHYRLLDVSSVKILAQRWKPEIFKEVNSKESSHRAMDDVIDSIEELKFYRENFFL